MLNKKVLYINPKEIASRIYDFISDQISHSRLDGAIVSVSGGIDSAVTLALTVNALGNEKVRAVTLPECDVTPKQDITDVIDLTTKLNVTCDIVDITPILHVMYHLLPLYHESDQITSGNLKPRIRMTIVYHYANALHRMVVGSSCKSELLTGYFTKFGDGGVDIMPLGDLFKTQVRQLAKHLGIPRIIIEKPPSAGLWPGQSDEGELGIKYKLLDLILYAWEKGMGPSEVATELNIDENKVVEILDRVKRNEHKRRTPLILRLSEGIN